MPLLPVLLSPSTRHENPARALLAPADLPPLVATNPALAAGVVGALLATTEGASSTVALDDGTAAGSAGMKTTAILSALVRLPPTLPTFDVLGRLLRDGRIVKDNVDFGNGTENGNGLGGTITIADLIRIDVLGRFVAASIDWLDNAEREEREGRASEDRWAQGVVHVGYFCLIFATQADLNCEALPLLRGTPARGARRPDQRRGQCGDGAFQSAARALRRGERAVSYAREWWDGRLSGV